MVKVSAGGNHSCALLGDGTVKCWGKNNVGQLGLGDTRDRGTGLWPLGDALPAVDLGSNVTVIDIAAGGNHTCALLEGGVKCWGNNSWGQLGLGHINIQGDDEQEMGDRLPFLNLTAPIAIATGTNYSCALLQSGDVSCWGDNSYGQLGLGHTQDIGRAPSDIEPQLPLVDLGDREVGAIALGGNHSCALFSDQQAICWGDNHAGQLGQGDRDSRGNIAPIDDLPPILLGAGTTVEFIEAGSVHTCAGVRPGDGMPLELKCWGSNHEGALGLGLIDEPVGDTPEEMSGLTAVELGTGLDLVSISLGWAFTCARLNHFSGAQQTKCWGLNDYGQLGLGDTQSRGTDASEMGDALPSLNLGAPPAGVSCGSQHSCVVTTDGRIKCWGDNSYGKLGIDSTEIVGDGCTGHLVANRTCPSENDEMGANLPRVDLGTCAGATDWVSCGYEVTSGPDFSNKVCLGHDRYPADPRCIMLGCDHPSCQTPGPLPEPDLFTPLPDTGQNRCYDNDQEQSCLRQVDGDCMVEEEYVTWCGQDGDYGYNPVDRFVVQTVTGFRYIHDTVTDLRWQGCAAGWCGSLCEVDPTTASERDWFEALSYCQDLEWAGHSDWRLPDIYELSSLLHFAIPLGENAAINPAFTATPKDLFWSSTPEKEGRIWLVDFGQTILERHPQSRTHPVRCVRGGDSADPEMERFTEDGDDQRSVRDGSTGLTWTGCPFAVAADARPPSCNGPLENGTWSKMLSTCEQLVWNGCDDWRLPNFNELISIVDFQGRRLHLEGETGPLWDDASWIASSSTLPRTPTQAFTVTAEPDPGSAGKFLHTFTPICVRNTIDSCP